MRVSTRTARLTSTLLVAGLGVGTGAHSQEAAPAQPAAQDEEKLQEIVVTAQKREQLLQDVPIAVTVLSGDTLQANRVENVTDLNGLAPGLRVTPAAGSSSIPGFTLRGITAYGVVPGTDKETSLYLDGVYIGSPRGSIFDLPDTQRIEVLRGPQGTLFGRNATAGAINVVTRNPTGDLDIHEDVSVGNYDEVRTRTSVDLPAWGPFTAYGTFVHDENRGYIRNLGVGTFWNETGPDTHLGTGYSPSYLGGHNKNSIFVTLRFEPNEVFRATYKFDWATDHFTPDAEVPIGINPNSPLIGSLLSGLISSQPTPVSFVTNGLRPDAVNNSFDLPGYQRNTGHNLTVEVYVNDHLSFKDILAYRDSYLNSNSQLDGIGGLTLTSPAVLNYSIYSAFSSNPALATASLQAQTAAVLAALARVTPLVGDRLGIIPTYNQDWSKQWSDEPQVNYNAKYLTLTAGALYYWQEDYVGGPPGITNTPPFVLVPTSGNLPLGNTSENYLESHSVAGYTQAEAHLVPGTLDLVGGLRVTHDTKSGRYDSGGTYVPGAGGGRTDGTFTGITAFPFAYNKTEWTYSGGVNYMPQKGTLLYAKYSTGYVSGGSVGDVPFRPETVKSWEVGAKGDFLESRLRTNLALYYARYDDVQSPEAGINVGHPELSTVVVDQGTTLAKGIELELAALPMTGLTMGASFGYTKASFEDFNPLIAESVGLTAAQANLYEPVNIPKWTTDLSAEYQTVPVFSQARLVFHADANWHDTIAYGGNPMLGQQIPPFASVLTAPPAWIVNARVALRDIKTGPMTTEVAFWTRNLTNNRDFNFPLDLNGFEESTSFVQPRTFGLDLNLKY
jgi:iron complex outermembrane recepter protein